MAMAGRWKPHQIARHGGEVHPFPKVGGRESTQLKHRVAGGRRGDGPRVDLAPHRRGAGRDRLEALDDSELDANRRGWVGHVDPLAQPALVALELRYKSKSNVLFGISTILNTRLENASNASK